MCFVFALVGIERLSIRVENKRSPSEKLLITDNWFSFPMHLEISDPDLVFAAFHVRISLLTSVSHTLSKDFPNPVTPDHLRNTHSTYCQFSTFSSPKLVRTTHMSVSVRYRVFCDGHRDILTPMLFAQFMQSLSNFVAISIRANAPC